MLVTRPTFARDTAKLFVRVHSSSLFSAVAHPVILKPESFIPPPQEEKGTEKRSAKFIKSSNRISSSSRGFERRRKKKKKMKNRDNV